MKTLVLLLACLAAANAHSYIQAPCQYRTWSIQRFCIYPRAETFQFKVHYCGSWYTTKYYSSIMKVYPDSNCSEMTEAEFTTDCEGKLRIRADAILAEIRSHYFTFKYNLASQVAAAKQKYEDSISRYANVFLKYVWCATDRQRYIGFRSVAIINYNNAIDKMAKAAIDSYARALLQRYYTVLSFHKKIVDNAVKCYQTRLQKINDFSSALDKRIMKYLVTFKTTTAEIVEKKASAYRALLYKVHCSNYWKIYYINQVVDLYKNREIRICLDQATNYWNKLTNMKNQLVSYYRCVYKCATYSGCTNFAKKDYHTYCNKLGAWWSITIDRSLSCFRYVDYKYSWKKTEYKDLKTCDLNAVNQSLGDFEAAMEAKGADAVNAARNVFAAWKMKWVRIHVTYYNKYVAIVQQRHDFLLNYMRAQYYCRYNYLCGWHNTRLCAYEEQLKERKNAAIKKYQDMLWQRIVQACSTYVTRVANYKKMVNETVAKVVKAYGTCLDNKDAKIAEYKKSVIERRDNLRAKLMDVWYKIYSQKCQQYYDLMMFYHPGQKLCGAPFTLWSSYKSKIYYEYCNYYANFDAHWRTLAPQLVQHFACGYKCSADAKFAIPQLHCSFYNWQVSNPKFSCYSYEYQSYMRYRYYRLVKCNSGRYVYIA